MTDITIHSPFAAPSVDCATERGY